MVGGEELQPASSGELVRPDSGKVVPSDGPFIETKEQLGGFHLIEADDMDEAVRWAARNPAPVTTTIEVRPLVQQ